MAVNRIDIGSGIYLNLIDTAKFKTNHIAVNFAGKLERSTASMNALLLKVLKRGSAKYPTMLEVNRSLDMIYSSRVATRVFKDGDTQILGLSLNMLDDAFSIDGTSISAGVIDLLMDLIYNPLLEDGAFKAVYVESEKKNLKDDIAAKINNKNAYAMERCIEEMCADEVYSVSELGTSEDVDAITPQSLYKHYLSVISSLRVEIFFVGRFEAGVLTDKFKRAFAGVKCEGFADIDTFVKRTAGESREIVEEMQVNQGKLTLGFRTGSILSDGKWAQFALFNELFGGSPTSKLFENVREKLSLCYYCRSIPEAKKGLMLVACGIENENKQKAQDEILLQLDLINKGDFDEKALSDSKKSLINGYKELNDSAAALEMWYLRRAMVGMSDSPDDMAAGVASVTKEQVIEQAGKITLDTIYFLKGTLTQSEEGAENEE